jgi:hypothetical protein
MEKLKADTSKKSCLNCEYAGAQLNLGTKTIDHVCRRRPGTAVAAFVPGQMGLEVKVATAWPPVTPNDWCGEFQRKMDS